MQLNMVRQHPLAANRKGCFLGLHPIFVSNSFIPALWLSLAVTGRRELWGSSEFLQQNIQAVWARVWNLQRWMWEASRLDAVAVSNCLFYDSMTDPNCLFSSGLKPPSTDLSERAKPGLFVIEHQKNPDIAFFCEARETWQSQAKSRPTPKWRLKWTWR